MWLPSVALWGFFKIVFFIPEIIIRVFSGLPDEVLLQNNIKITVVTIEHHHISLYSDTYIMYPDEDFDQSKHVDPCCCDYYCLI